MLRRDPAAAMRALLEKEFDLLTRADFPALAGCIPEKEKLSRQLSEATPAPDRAVTRQLQAMAERNAHMLRGAQQGILAAGKRLSQIRQGCPLNTYGQDGHVSRLDATIGSISRRA